MEKKKKIEIYNTYTPEGSEIKVEYMTLKVKEYLEANPVLICENCGLVIGKNIACNIKIDGKTGNIYTLCHNCDKTTEYDMMVIDHRERKY